MSASSQAVPASKVKLMSGEAYRESLRRYKPRVFVDGREVGSVADEPSLRPGVNALAFTYDYALRPELEPIALATQHSRNRVVARMLHVNESAGDLLNKLEAVRVLCQETGCAQRYLAHDALNGIHQAVAHIDDARGSTEHRARFAAYLADVQERDLSLGVAMTDAKGDRSKKPHQQAKPDTYVHVVEKNAKGIVISGTKAIVTGGPYMHELLVMPSRNMGREDEAFAVCCAVPVDAPGITLVARPAGRPGEKLEHGDALFSRKYGQSTAVVLFDRVFVPWERVFYAGEWEHSQVLTYSYATHHRHSCIAARAGFGDLLIGAGALMCEANGLDPAQKANLRDPMVELIKITEGFYACGVAASVYATRDEHSGSFMPEPVFANIGKLLLATQIYDMHRIAHEVSGGLIVALPGPDEDHNPETAARLSEVLQANTSIPYEQRIQTARFIEDLTASYQGGWYSVISLHGGGSPAAMKQEIWRNYPVGSKVELVERLLERGVLHDEQRAGKLGGKTGEKRGERLGAARRRPDRGDPDVPLPCGGGLSERRLRRPLPESRHRRLRGGLDRFEKLPCVFLRSGGDVGRFWQDRDGSRVHGLKGLFDLHRIPAGTHDHDGARGVGFHDAPGRFETVHSAHVDVHRDDIGPLRREEGERLLAAACAPRDADFGIGAQDAFQDLPHQRGIVDDENAYHGIFPSPSARRYSSRRMTSIRAPWSNPPLTI